MSEFGGLLKFIAEKFAGAKVRYAMIGGFGLHAFGYSRATGDVDMLVHVDDIAVVKDILSRGKFEVLHESEDVLNMNSPWQLIGGVDIIKAHRKYTFAMLDRARSCPFVDGLAFPVAVPEDIIGLKVQAIANDPARHSKDWADIEWLVGHHAARMDKKLLEEYFTLFGMQAELKKLLGARQ